MGQTIWIETRGRPQAETAQDCSVSHALADQLDDLAARSGVESFSGFFDYSELNVANADLLAEAGIELPDEPAGATWFDSALGLKTIRILQDRLATHPAELRFRPRPGQEHWLSKLTDELQHFRAVLERAVADGQPFRLLIVP
jgi:hypothetical protein